MLDDDFVMPNEKEQRQKHVRKALKKCRFRGQWVRDAGGRLGVLPADKDWKNDRRYGLFQALQGLSRAEQEIENCAKTNEAVSKRREKTSTDDAGGSASVSSPIEILSDTDDAGGSSPIEILSDTDEGVAAGAPEGRSCLDERTEHAARTG
jgi:hypothetical protein